MAKVNEIFIDYERFKLGIYALDDTTKAPFGSARTMRNVTVTDRGGMGPRKGTQLLGDFNPSTSPTRGLYNFRKSFDQQEFLIKAYDDELEVLGKNFLAAGWWRLKNLFTPNKEFGFVTSLVNTENEDYVLFCNRYEPYQSWLGSVTLLNGALAGGETTVTVDSTLTDEVFESKTATANAATTIDVSTALWAASQFVGMYVYITAGVHAGKIRKITANTSTQITFDTLGSGPGNVAFEIRKLAFPPTGRIMYGGTSIAYSGIPSATEFTVGSAHAAADNTALTVVPEEHPAAPRGNRIANFLSRVVVGNVRSALARDDGGALTGVASAGSYFVSKVNDPKDFSFSATRVAGEGDIISTPYGGGDITDVIAQEDSAYVFKARYIETVKYSQDEYDIANRTPLKSEVGATGSVIKGSDDVYFMTEDRKFTSLGRVATKDVLPQTDNIGFSIQRILNTYTFGEGRGIEDVDRIYIPAKSSTEQAQNDIVLVYNKVNKSFEGIWDIYANFFARFQSKLYFGESTTPNVYELNVGHADVVGDDRFPISASYASNFLNLTSSHGNTQALNSLYFEGYISDEATITFKAWKDFSEVPFLSFDFAATETRMLDGSEIMAALGANTIGLQPIGAVGEVDAEGRRHFYFRVYFPYEYGNHFSVGFESSGVDYDYELTRFGLGLAESVSTDANRIKNV